jgi:Planctomycete cytochrome C
MRSAVPIRFGGPPSRFAGPSWLLLFRAFWTAAESEAPRRFWNDWARKSGVAAALCHRSPKVAAPPRRVFHILCLRLTLALGAFPAHGFEVDTNQLPPAANVKIDFARDIRPILEQSCWRCHGSEKPRSRFNLMSREAALKGGMNGVDILAGDGTGSPLIHYVARLVPDMEMPPPEKGEPLTAEQVGRLRAWIDQGAEWGAGGTYPQTDFSIVPTVRWVDVHGDNLKFREVEGFKEGWGGGVEHFSLEQREGPDKKFDAEGHLLFQDRDFQLKLTWTKTDVGFVRAGIERWRKYYDDTGGYYAPFTPPSFNLNRDLHLDIGRVWFDLGLTLPGWPQMVLGYEVQTQDGDKSMLEWGNVNGKNIYPAAKAIRERTDIAKFDLAHDFLGWHLEDNARVEIYNDQTSSDTVLSYTTGPGPDVLVQTHEGFTHIQGANTLRLEKQVKDWWLLSGGYLYSRFDGDASFSQTTTHVPSIPFFYGTFWNSDAIMLKREAHVFSVASLLQPLECLSVSLGLQNEWSHQEGFGRINLDEGDPTFPDPGPPLIFLQQPATVQSDLDRFKASENADIRFTAIPFTVFFAEGRFDQDRVGQFEQETGAVPTAFLRDTDYVNNHRDVRAGFNTSPWPWLSWSAHYRNDLSDSDYNNKRDEALGLPGVGYSAFIRARTIQSDEVETKLVLRPARWLKTTLTYQLTANDYFTTTDPVAGGISPGGNHLAGNYDAHVYGFSAALTPFAKWYLTATFTYSDSRTIIANNDLPGVQPYRGDIYSVIASASYAVNARTDLQITYTFSEANYNHNNVADGVPLGLDYDRHALMAGITRRLSEHVTANLRYGFYRYSEPSTGGLNDYTAHGIFATVAVKWP